MRKIRVRQTRSGVMIRYDPGIGLLVYSPFTGLVFAVHDRDVPLVTSWLDGELQTPPSPEYANALGPGWFISHDHAQYPVPHLLPPSEDLWPTLLEPKRPIVINWFVTGMCPLACRYCYAEDLMRNRDREPKDGDIERIAESILCYRPLAVVLTGGDPLSSDHLAEAIRLLHGRTGIIVDTCAHGFNDKLVSLFRKYNVAVRISFDSERPTSNDAQRVFHRQFRMPSASQPYTLYPAVDALCACLDANLTVCVQSVATKVTANDLPVLGDKLFRLGVRAWRVFKVQPSESRWNEYKELIGSERKQKKLYPHIFDKLVRRYRNRWSRKMALQITHDETRNAVILVTPDGVFHTESNIRPAKVIIDEGNPFRPRLHLLYAKVNMLAHAERYLNLTTYGFLDQIT